MLNNYLELRVKNEIFIVEKLYSNDRYTISDFIDSLHVSETTVYNYLYDLTEILQKDISVRSRVPSMEKTSLWIDLKKVYSRSDFLLVLSFFLRERENYSISNFIRDSGLSKAKVYSIRGRVIDYLERVGLRLVNNVIDGEDLKKILLMAKITATYGIRLLPKSIIRSYNTYTEHFLEEISTPYLSAHSKKIFKYALLVILHKGKGIDLNLSTTRIDLEDVFLIPIEVKKSIQNYVRSVFKPTNYEQQISNMNFLFILFSTSVLIVRSQKEIEEKLCINTLLNLFAREFSSNVIGSSFFRFLLIDSVKQGLLGGFEFLVDETFTAPSSVDISKKVLNVMESYKDVLPIEEPTKEYVLYFLCAKIEQVLIQNSQAKLYIFSDSYAEYLEIYYSLKKCLKVNVKIVDSWFYTTAKLELFSGKNNIIVTSIENVDNKLFNNKKNVVFIKIPLDKTESRLLNEQIFLKVFDS